MRLVSIRSTLRSAVGRQLTFENRERENTDYRAVKLWRDAMSAWKRGKRAKAYSLFQELASLPDENLPPGMRQAVDLASGLLDPDKSPAEVAEIAMSLFRPIVV